MSAFADRIDAELQDATLPGLVRAYYDPAGTFAGHTFDDGDNPPNRFTASDLLALTTLDVSCPPLAIRKLLHGEGWSRLLGGIPAGVDLWDADDGALHAAGSLWDALTTELDGVGPTTAGKLLARKRPRLIPIWDSVVDEVLQPEKDAFWTSMRDALTDPDRRHRIDILAEAVHPRPTTLRTLDVAIWMRHGRSKNLRSVGGGGQPLPR